MREIKFRAWHHGAGDQRVKGRMTTSEPFKVLFWKAVDEEPIAVEVMQYTGLFDKNGVEIYEGDVLKSFHYTDVINNTEQYLFHFVKWSEKYSGWFATNCSSMDDNNGSVQMFVYLKRQDCEVIGNIYENPELLEDI